MKFRTIVFKSIRKVVRFVKKISSKLITKYLFFSLDVENEGFESNGVPKMIVTKGRVKIGKNFKMNNGLSANTIGFPSPCVIIADNADLVIGDNVGISQTAIVAYGADVVVGNNVLMGGGVKVYSTDFHSLNYQNRRFVQKDAPNRKSMPVHIGDDVFIGAGSIILKGVSIGNRSIVGAGSVVTKDIPSDEIWAGNPAAFVRKLDCDKC